MDSIAAMSAMSGICRGFLFVYIKQISFAYLSVLY